MAGLDAFSCYLDAKTGSLNATVGCLDTIMSCLDTTRSGLGAIIGCLDTISAVWTQQLAAQALYLLHRHCICCTGMILAQMMSIWRP